MRDKKKKIERRGLRKRGVKIHPFHLPWIRAWDESLIVKQGWGNLDKTLWDSAFGIVAVGELMQVLKTRCTHTKQRSHQQKIFRSTT